MKQYIIFGLFILSVSFNLLATYVLFDDVIFEEQQNYAIQYLGDENAELQESIATGLCLERLW